MVKLSGWAPVAVPLLAPVNAMDPSAAAEEVAGLVEAGFRTLQVKVGFAVAADLRRVAAIQRASAGGATLRLDANQAFSREEGCDFAVALDPAGIELLEQPCDKSDWDANAAVAAVSWWLVPPYLALMAFLLLEPAGRRVSATNPAFICGDN